MSLAGCVTLNSQNYIKRPFGRFLLDFMFVGWSYKTKKSLCYN